MNPALQSKTIPVFQGELAVSCESDVVLSAILGSCVATCLWDPVLRVGGMNHILLPGNKLGDPTENKYGVYAMEALINAMMKLGSSKQTMVAKVFGGASTFENGLGIGAANARFARSFLEFEGIEIKAECTGGTQSRRLRFMPESGLVQQLLTGRNAAQEVSHGGVAPKPGRPLIGPPKAGLVELF